MQNETPTTNILASLSVSLVAFLILAGTAPPGSAAVPPASAAAKWTNENAGYRNTSNRSTNRSPNWRPNWSAGFYPAPSAAIVVIGSAGVPPASAAALVVPVANVANSAISETRILLASEPETTSESPSETPSSPLDTQASEDQSATESSPPPPAQVKPNDAGIAAGDGGCVGRERDIPRPTEPAEEDQETLLSDAGLLLRQGKQTELIELTNNILKKWPDCVEAQSMRGMAYLALEKIPEAIADLTAAIDSKKMRSRQVLMYLSRGVAYSHQDKYAEAIADLNSAILIDPKNQQLWLTRGSLYQRSKNFDKAIDDLTKGLQLDPNGPNQAIFLSARADVYSQAGKADLALKDLNRAIKLKPQDPNAYMNRAAEYIKAKNWTNAIQDLDRVIDFAPMGKLSNNALILRASSLKNAGRLEDSLKDYSNLVLAYRSDPKFLSARAEVYLALGQKEKALDDMNICLKKDKSQKQYYELHAKICQAMNLLVEESKDREQIKLLESKGK